MRPVSNVLSPVSARVRDFAGAGGATYLWPRWLFLRAVGVVFLVVFAGIIDESRALIGPNGLVPLSGLVAQLKASAGGGFLKTPTLFWFNTSPGMIGLLEWSGFIAGLGLVCNVWPRVSLAVCWACLLSFAQAWVIFSDPALDWLMLEVALLSIPFAPAGVRPGLGAASPPLPITTFMLRWLLFRVMFECGLSKYIHSDPRWWNLTAMDDLYQTAPSPTILGYLDHQMPHGWHVGEIGLTLAAEIVAPLLAVFGGRRGRWIAFFVWSLFQAGIQLTCNFGWLNTASFALGLLLLDDQMLTAAAQRLRLKKLAARLAAVPRVTVTVVKGWRLNTLRTALWLHFAFGLAVFAEACKLPENPVTTAVLRPFKAVFQGFGSVNSYALFAWLDQSRSVVEFTGSNDGGVTWRTYDFRYFPQRADRISPFIAPWFPRFEGAMQIILSTRDKPTTLFGITATRLLERNREVMGLFERDPFPDVPPQMIRMPVYRLSFTDLATHRATREFWHRNYVGEYMPMKYVNGAGQVVEAASVFEQVYVKAAYGNPQAASYLGELYLNGEEGAEKDLAEAVKWFHRAAAAGQAGSQYNLALLYGLGNGVPRNAVEAARWCRLAAEQGLPEAQDRLGLIYVEGDGVPRDAVEALMWFRVALLSGSRNAFTHEALLRSQLTPAQSDLADERAKAVYQRISARQKKSATPTS